jgi:hypothetical protein
MGTIHHGVVNNKNPGDARDLLFKGGQGYDMIFVFI